MKKENKKTEVKIFLDKDRLKKLDRISKKMYDRPRRAIVMQAFDEFLESN